MCMFLEWFKNYLDNRKQYISIENGENTKYETITCGVPQGSILGPLLFLLYVNDISNCSEILDFILFADDTNIFYSHNNIKTLFENVNEELQKLHNWILANKLSLNLQKTKYSIFHKQGKCEDLPLKFPNLIIDNIEIKRETTMKFLGVLLDEHLTWKAHISMIEKNISKNTGILYKARPLIDKKNLRNLYFAYIQSHINYACSWWASTTLTNLKPIFTKQKHALRIINYKARSSDTRELFKESNILNVFQLNIYQILIFMFKVKNDKIPITFKQYFSEVHHKYKTRQSDTNFKIPKKFAKQTAFRISYRGCYLWNNFLSVKEKKISSLNSFKNNIKKLLLSKNNEQSFFFKD